MQPTGAEQDRWRQAWAKWSTAKVGERPSWLPLHTHLIDTGLVSGFVWDEWLGAGVRAVIAADCDGSLAQARRLVMGAAALHDLGKCTRAFAGQVGDAKVEMEAVGFRWGLGAVASDSRSLPHALAGEVLAEEYLMSLGVPPVNARAFAVIIGGHHGVPPNDSELVEAARSTRLLGQGEWDEARRALIAHVLATIGVESAPVDLRTVRLSDASQLLITAIVIMADWIASNPEYFPLMPMPHQVAGDPRKRAFGGWRTLGLPDVWRPTDDSLTQDVTRLLRSRFDVPYDANEVQRLAVEAAREAPEPGLMLIEAVMGAGKTEAALLAAEVLAHRFGQVGVFYGLPTRATTDAMFHRALTWWRNVPGVDDERVARGVALRHSTAWLNPEFRALPRSARVGSADQVDDGPLAGPLVDVGRDVPAAPQWDGRARPQEAAVIAHRWTSGRKQASFADTVIATIDHELLAALATRHVVLRHLGLARQVVILDEVHSADTWMRVYLERALAWLGRYRTPVIVLSATLAPDQRQGLVDAYERGRRAGLPAERVAAVKSVGGLTGSRRVIRPPLPRVPNSDQYPLVTVLSGGSVSQSSADPPPARDIEVAWLPDSLDDLVSAVDPTVSADGCVLIVCNTVTRAIARYRLLRGSYGEGVTLAHSRFIATDRVAKDSWLRATFGPGPGDRAARIVVATQVAEQSLDVDFDLLITDLAPIDLLLQRIGRLHRHSSRERPDAARVPCCLVTALPDAPNDGGPPELDPGGVRVYGSHHLLRTAALLKGYVSAGRPLVLPDDVPGLVRDCYGDAAVGPQTWRDAMTEAEAVFATSCADDESGAEQFRLRAPGERPSVVGLLNTNVGEAETSAGATKQVRKDDGGFEVIVLHQAEDGVRLLPHLDDGRPLPTDERPDRDTVRLLAQSMVRVPGWVTTAPADLNQILDQLAANYFRGWQKDPVLAGQLVLLLEPEGVGALGRFRVSYDTEVGLEVSRG